MGRGRGFIEQSQREAPLHTLTDTMEANESPEQQSSSLHCLWLQSGLHTTAAGGQAATQGYDMMQSFMPNTQTHTHTHPHTQYSMTQAPDGQLQVCPSVRF